MFLVVVKYSLLSCGCTRANTPHNLAGLVRPHKNAQFEEQGSLFQLSSALSNYDISAISNYKILHIFYFNLIQFYAGVANVKAIEKRLSDVSLSDHGVYLLVCVNEEKDRIIQVCHGQNASKLKAPLNEGFFFAQLKVSGKQTKGEIDIQAKGIWRDAIADEIIGLKYTDEAKKDIYDKIFRAVDKYLVENHQIIAVCSSGSEDHVGGYDIIDVPCCDGKIEPPSGTVGVLCVSDKLGKKLKKELNFDKLDLTNIMEKVIKSIAADGQQPPDPSQEVKRKNKSYIGLVFIKGNPNLQTIIEGVDDEFFGKHPECNVIKSLVRVNDAIEARASAERALEQYLVQDVQIPSNYRSSGRKFYTAECEADLVYYIFLIKQ